MTMNLRHLLFAVVPFSLAATSAGAISSYQQEVPNGTVFRCQTCHIRSGGGEGWNAFGQALLSAGGANPAANPNDQNDGFTGSPSDYWLDLCDDDSDGDGATNAEELGDLDCDAEPDEGLVPSNPGDETSVPDDPGEPGGGGGGDDLGGGGCSSTGSSADVIGGFIGLGLLALVRRVHGSKRR